MSDPNAALRERLSAHQARQASQTPHEAALAWQERSVEHQRHVEVVDRLGKVEALLTALCRRFGLEVSA